MKIEVHTEHATVSATRHNDSPTMWIDVTEGETEITVFVNADQAEALIADLTKHAKAARAIEHALKSVREEAVA